ncbi:type II toxin-antitoxin system RelE family toxin [Helicobacter sp. 23-1045]
MSYEIIIKKQVDKLLKNLSKSAPREFDRIDYFLNNTLSLSDNPCKLPNARRLKGFDDNRYRWRIGEYLLALSKTAHLKSLRL